jgi:hypothetical protein
MKLHRLSSTVVGTIILTLLLISNDFDSGSGVLARRPPGGRPHRCSDYSGRKHHCSKVETEHVRKLIHDFATGEVTNNFDNVYPWIDEDIDYYFLAQGNKHGKDALVATLDAYKYGGFGNFDITDYDPDFQIINTCHEGVVTINRTLYSPRSGHKLWISLFIFMEFNEDGYIVHLSKMENLFNLKYVLEYVFDDPLQFCLNYLTKCSGEDNVFRNTSIGESCVSSDDSSDDDNSEECSDIEICRRYVTDNIPQSVSETDFIINGDSLICRNFFLTALLNDAPGFTCDSMGPNSSVCF